MTEKQQVLNKINTCIHNTGTEVIRHISSNEAVYDIDCIRQALGDKQLTAVAYSYGTQIAILYVERFLYNVGSIVLDGVVDIDDLENSFTWQLKQTQSYQETFDCFASWCARAKSCLLSSDRDKAITQFHELLSKLHHKPLLDSKRENISLDELISLITDLLLWHSSWPILTAAIRQFSQGIVSNEIETALSVPIVLEESDDASGVILCVDQEDEQLAPEERKSRKGALANAFPAINFDNGRSDLPGFRELWPIHSDLNKTRLKNTILPSGLLFVARKYNPTAPWINTRKMAGKFPNPSLTINGDGHTLALTGVDLCIDKAIVHHPITPQKIENIYCPGNSEVEIQ